MSNYTHQQLARISELDTAIDAAADKGDDAFFAAVAAKDEYIDSQGIDRDRLEVTGRETQGNVQSPTLDAPQQGNEAALRSSLLALMQYIERDLENNSPEWKPEDVPEYANAKALLGQVNGKVSKSIEKAPPATKLVEVRLSALTRVEYMEVVEVPANITQAELDDLVSARYRQVDGGEFTSDPEYWERGTCEAVDSDMPDATPTMMAFRTEHGLHIERADAASQTVDCSGPTP
jgi:hypothetical protein